MVTDEDLIAEAIRGGRVRRVPTGAVVLPERRPQVAEPRVRPETCGSGRQRLAAPGADEQG